MLTKYASVLERIVVKRVFEIVSWNATNNCLGNIIRVHTEFVKLYFDVYLLTFQRANGKRT